MRAEMQNTATEMPACLLQHQNPQRIRGALRQSKNITYQSSGKKKKEKEKQKVRG